MKIATCSLIFFAFCVFPIFSDDRKKPDLLINGNGVISDALPEIKQALVEYGIDPLPLPKISDDYGDDLGHVLTNGLLTGAKNIEINGNWSLSIYKDENMIFTDGEFITDIVGNFTYSSKGYAKRKNCLLDFEMKDVKIQANAWYWTTQKIIYYPNIKIFQYSERYIYIDKCWPGFLRRRLGRSTEDNLQPKIFKAIEDYVGNILEKKAADKAVIDRYNSFISKARKEGTETED